MHLQNGADRPSVRAGARTECGRPRGGRAQDAGRAGAKHRMRGAQSLGTEGLQRQIALAVEEFDTEAEKYSRPSGGNYWPVAILEEASCVAVPAPLPTDSGPPLTCVPV